MKANRAARRSRGKRATYREAAQDVGKIMRLHEKGLSASAIAAGLPVSRRAVEAIIRTLEAGGTRRPGPDGEKAEAQLEEPGAPRA